MFKRIFAFVFICLIFCLKTGFTAEIKAKIKNICITGLFENSHKDPCIVTEYLLPVDGKTKKIDFTCDTASYLIPFTATFIKTTSDKEGKYFSDEVKIEYSSLANSDFYQNDAVLRFKVCDKNGNVLPIDGVIDYRRADFVSPGWILETTVFPADEVKFSTKFYSGNKGATNWAWFILQYSYPAAEP